MYFYVFLFNFYADYRVVYMYITDIQLYNWTDGGLHIAHISKIQKFYIITVLIYMNIYEKWGDNSKAFFPFNRIKMLTCYQT